MLIQEEDAMRDLTVAELMAREVITVRGSDLLRDAHTTMRLAGVRHLPVVEGHGVLVGILSDRDVLLAWSRGPDTPVSVIMTRYTEHASPGTPAREAAARMLKDKIGCLPVVDADGTVVGIITETDFLRVAHRALCRDVHTSNTAALS